MNVICEKPVLVTRRDKKWAKPGDLLTFFFFDALTGRKTITWGRVEKIEKGEVQFSTSFEMCAVSGLCGDESQTVNSWAVPLDSIFIIKKSEMLWFWLKAPFGMTSHFPSDEFEEFFKDGTKDFGRKAKDKVAELKKLYQQTIDDADFQHSYLATFLD